MAGKDSVRRIGGEFIIVVIGVLVALAVDEFREGRHEVRLGDFYLESLEADLVRDSTDLTSAAQRAALQSKMAAVIDSFVAFPEIEPDSTELSAAFRNLSGIVQPALHDGTYRDLIGSGNSRLIADPELRRKINAYYSLTEAAGEWAGESFESNAGRLPRGALFSGLAGTTAAGFRAWVEEGRGEAPSELPVLEILRALRADADASRIWLKRYELERAVAGAYFVGLVGRTRELLAAVRGATDP